MVISLNDLSISSILPAIQHIVLYSKHWLLEYLYILTYYYYQFLTISLWILFSKTSVHNQQYKIYQFIFKSLVASMNHGPMAQNET